jgi:hypothetical protein
LLVEHRAQLLCVAGGFGGQILQQLAEAADGAFDLMRAEVAVSG